MKTVVKNAPKGAKVNSVKNVAEILESTESGMALNLPENVKGEKVKKARKINEIAEARKEAVNDYLDATMKLSQVLKNIKQYNEKYLKVIELQYGVKISTDMLNNVIPSNFINLQTDKQKENQAKSPERWSFRKVLQLIAKYYKNEQDKMKIVERVAKLNLA